MVSVCNYCFVYKLWLGIATLKILPSSSVSLSPLSNNSPKTVAEPIESLSCPLTLIEMRNLLDAICPIWLCLCAGQPRLTATEELNHLVNRLTLICCHNLMLVSSRQMVKSESIWKGKVFCSLFYFFFVLMFFSWSYLHFCLWVIWVSLRRGTYNPEQSNRQFFSYGQFDCTGLIGHLKLGHRNFWFLKISESKL